MRTGSDARAGRLAHGVLALAVASLAGGTPDVRAGDLVVRVLDAKGRPVEDAVVSATSLGARPPTPAQAPRAEIDQIDQEFVPHVSVVRLGTQVAFPNRDAVRHHVYSFSEPKKFELPLYKGTPAAPVTFDAPGLVVLGCNIHDWMLAYVYVLDTPWFAKTGADGTARLTGLGAGEYEVRAQHPRAKSEPAAQRTTAGATDATLEFRLELKPDFRRPRSGRPGEAGYR